MNAVDDRPSTDDGTHPTDEDTTLDVPAGQGVLAGGSDVENTTIVVELVSGPAKSNLTLDADGAFRCDPASIGRTRNSFSVLQSISLPVLVTAARGSTASKGRKAP